MTKKYYRTTIVFEVLACPNLCGVYRHIAPKAGPGGDGGMT